MKKILLSFFIFIAIISNVQAQKSDIGNWFIYFGNQAINKKFNWYNEVQYRNYNAIGDLQQLVLRTGIGYNLTENNNNILLGYGYIHSQNYLPNKTDKVSNNEHRIYQQFLTRQNFGRVFLQHRYRIEERILETDFQIRFRYFISANIPIGKKTMAPNTFYASAYNELFINAQNTYFDRNRLYGAIGYVFNKSFKAEFGFMAQTQQTINRNQFQVMFFNNLPLSKAKK